MATCHQYSCTNERKKERERERERGSVKRCEWTDYWSIWCPCLCGDCCRSKCDWFCSREVVVVWGARRSNSCSLEHPCMLPAHCVDCLWLSPHHTTPQVNAAQQCGLMTHRQRTSVARERIPLWSVSRTGFDPIRGGSKNLEKGAENNVSGRRHLLQMHTTNYMPFIREKAAFWEKNSEPPHCSLLESAIGPK